MLMRYVDKDFLLLFLKSHDWSNQEFEMARREKWQGGK
jgi:hypothetical protein